jgi:hypothetical protein
MQQPVILDGKKAISRLVISALTAYREAILSGNYSIHEHARNRMEERGIAKGDLLKAVTDGDLCFAHRREGEVRGIYHYGGICVVVSAQSRPGINFWTLKPTVVTVYNCEEEYEPLDEIPLVPYSVEVDRPLESYDLADLEAAIEQKRTQARSVKKDRLTARRTELESHIAAHNARITKLEKEREGYLQTLAEVVRELEID